ncbi:hypothetical protein A6R68_13965 [Neotoma lepida]|uniref:Uncharacterized protein n=1 Tax=Neotoma lepida TaxID=56216 RepID=A0A1A6HA27_NEOLE|nr:hypothetical protein A6R68_13965 [Neotoma lepida]
MNTNPSQGSYHFQALHFLVKVGRHAALQDQARPDCPGMPQGVRWDPSTCDEKKWLVVPAVLKVVRLKPNQKVCSSGAYVAQEATETARKNVEKKVIELTEVLKTSGFLV